MKFRILLLVLVLSCIRTVNAQTVFDIIANSPNHTTLEAAIRAAGLEGALSGAGPLTVFAPTDDAFDALPAGTVDALLNDIPTLTAILTYHVVGEAAVSSDLSDGQTITTLNGKGVKITINTAGVFVNDAQVSTPDLIADNGVVHVIDAVLLPPFTVYDIIAESSDHTTLKAAVDAAGLDGTLKGQGPFTVFAPTDAAFAALPAGTIDSLLAEPQGLLRQILLYHVAPEEFLSTELNDGLVAFTLLPYLETVTVTINNEGIFINNAKVTIADIESDNGIVHVIDAVLLPSSQSVMDIIANSTQHSLLTAAINVANLGQTLDSPGSFTVFAPTNAAFNALPEGTLEAVLNDIPTLTTILTYHVVGAEALSTDLSDGQVITTLNGKDVTVTINNDGVFINNAKVTVADIVADNGVVHVIDAVLLPPTITVYDIIESSEDHLTLKAAIDAAGLDGALLGEGPFTVFAPTDEAFEALPDGTIDALLNDIPTLTAILTYHVVGAEALSTDLSDGQIITTLNRRNITVTINNDGVFINNAQVTVADIVADNGVVHVIDAVLLPPVTVYDIIDGSEDHLTLKAAIDAAGLDGALLGEGPFTVFAPTDEAFEALPDGTIDALLNDIPTLTAILTYHVVGAEALSTDLSDGQIITTLNGRNITVTINADGVFINNAQVTVADIVADNGVVHVIDAVLLPPVTVYDIIDGSEDHLTLKAAIDAAGLEGALLGEGPFTVFAPTDEAFEALPDGTIEALLNDIPTLTAILTYHVVGAEALSTDLSDGQVITTLNGKDVTVTINADGVFINNAQVTVADIVADNGVVHVIDAVLLPPAFTVYDIIEGSEDHLTLLAAIDIAGLDVALQGEGPFTVFAPTDAAFEALPEGTIEALINDIPTLTAILTYHVVGAEALSTDLSDGQVITTLNGKDVTVTINADGVFINNAQVTVADIVADNGVVHVIDAVLLPPVTVYDIISNSSDHTTLKAAIDAAGLDETLNTDFSPIKLTVFAPTDAAFEALPDGLIDALLQDPEGALTDVLFYHVTAAFDNITSDLIVDQFEDGFRYLQMLNGKTVTIDVNADGVFVNNAKVTVVDLEASNGIVHVIDAVLVAPEFTIIDVVEQSEDHQLLSNLLDIIEIKEPLRGYGPFTLFAPTDDAILALGQETIDALLADDELLAEILLYHVVGGLALSTDLSNGQKIETLLGEEVTVNINNDGVFINNAKVTVADIITDNGVVHVIDAVILLPTNTVYDIIAGSPDHTTLKAAIDVAGLDEALQGDGPFTVFAPTDAAFSALPEGTIEALLNDIPTLTAILTYHVVGAEALSTDLTNGQRITTLNGGDVTVTIGTDGIFINDARVTVADLQATNGVVHVINAVLLPESSTQDINLVDNISVYPNPTANVITLNTPEDINTSWDVHIMDSQGRSMLKTSAKHEDTINTQTINSGTYILHITNGEKSIMKKLVKF